MTDAELIKSKIDIVNFISEYIPIKKAGRNFKANCPFHHERTPSFIVSPERQSWHCFGACSEGGDAITFLQKWENIEFLEALNILAQKTGVTLSNYAPSQNLRLKEKLYAINHLTSEFFHYLLSSHKLGEKAREYLDSRGINKEIIKTFVLGYAPNSWDSLLRFLYKKGYSSDDIFTAGLLVKSESGCFYDRFRGRLMFTLKDHRGNFIGFSGRKIPTLAGSLSENDKEAKYVNTPETPIYIKGHTLYGLDITKESIKKEKEAVVVEGEFDMLSSFQSGVTNVVAIKGSALTEGQVMLLKRFAENLVLALDSDFAGNEAARRGIEIADDAGLSVKVANLLAGKDPAECVEKGAHLWKKSVKTSIPIYDFIIAMALKKYDKNEVNGKKKIGSEVVPFLAKITNPIIQSHYIKQLSSELAVGEESIGISIRQFQKKEIRPQNVPTVSTKSIFRHELLEEYLLALIIQSENPDKSYKSIMRFVSFEDFSLPPIKNIMEQLSIYLKNHEKFTAKKFSSTLSPEIAPAFDKAFMLDIEHILSKEETYSKELGETAKEVKKSSLRRTINNLSTKIKQAEMEDKNEDVRLFSEKLLQMLEHIRELDKSTQSRLN